MIVIFCTSKNPPPVKNENSIIEIDEEEDALLTAPRLERPLAEKRPINCNGVCNSFKGAKQEEVQMAHGHSDEAYTYLKFDCINGIPAIASKKFTK